MDNLYDDDVSFSGIFLYGGRRAKWRALLRWRTAATLFVETTPTQGGFHVTKKWTDYYVQVEMTAVVHVQDRGILPS